MLTRLADDGAAGALSDLFAELTESSELVERLKRQGAPEALPDVARLERSFARAIELARLLNQRLARRRASAFTSVSRAATEIGVALAGALPDGLSIRVVACADPAVIEAPRADFERALLALCESASMELGGRGEIVVEVAIQPAGEAREPDVGPRVRVAVKSSRGAASLPPVATEFARALGGSLSLRATPKAWFGLLELPCR